MLRVARREREGCLREKDIKAFPSKDLVTINKLWLSGSDGRFGFSVQKEIWMELGGKSNIYDEEIFQLFLKTLEWEEENRILFELRAELGHLPFGIYVKGSNNAKLHHKWWAAIDIYIKEDEEEIKRLKEKINKLEEDRNRWERQVIFYSKPGQIRLDSSDIFMGVPESLSDPDPYFFLLKRTEL
jgi:hypothetical protein